ncbi:MAG: hypothetical protein JWP19_464 [Rhodoglobus sp.]|nr:hypothetical protein [Rhodoglobus sp.]
MKGECSRCLDLGLLNPFGPPPVLKDGNHADPANTYPDDGKEKVVQIVESLSGYVAIQTFEEVERGWAKRT